MSEANTSDKSKVSVYINGSCCVCSVIRRQHHRKHCAEFTNTAVLQHRWDWRCVTSLFPMKIFCSRTRLTVNPGFETKLPPQEYLPNVTTDLFTNPHALPDGFTGTGHQLYWSDLVWHQVAFLNVQIQVPWPLLMDELHSLIKLAVCCVLNWFSV